MLFDSHCHLQERRFNKDKDEVIKRAFEAGVEEFLICGYDIPSSEEGIQLAREKDGFYASCGIHPHDAKKLNSTSLDKLKELARDVVAIGEIGLDFYRDLSPRDVQVEAFKTQIDLAREMDLPIIVHVRDAYSEALSTLKEMRDKYRGVVHCFSGDAGDAAEAVKLGFYISFSGSITFNSARLEHALRSVPADRLLMETDAPYLAPQPYRGKRNEPAYLRVTCEKIARTLNISYEDVARITRVNARLLFLKELPPPALVYKLGSSLYLNVTNRCTNRCSFCIRAKSPFLRGYNLKLVKEPTGEELLTAIGDPNAFEEIVFCGYGEPLIRLKLVKELAGRLKDRGARVRVNTNGEANLIHGRNIVPEIAGVVDSLSISLNAESKEKYLKLCKPQFGPNAYNSILDFARKAKKEINEVTLSVVAVAGVNTRRCRKIADQLGCGFKIRREFEGAGFR